MIRAAFYSLLFAAMVVIGIVQRDNLLHAYSLATSRQPESYTELYFSDVTKLPLQVTAGKSYDYTVHVTNHEAKARTYVLVATVAIPKRPTTVTKVTIRLDDKSGVDERFSFSIPDTQETATVTVTLQDEQQHIQFKSQS